MPHPQVQGRALPTAGKTQAPSKGRAFFVHADRDKFPERYAGAAGSHSAGPWTSWVLIETESFVKMRGAARNAGLKSSMYLGMMGRKDAVSQPPSTSGDGAKGQCVQA